MALRVIGDFIQSKEAINNNQDSASKYHSRGIISNKT